jgi:RNA polymerase sporulation-specific sigma factor
MMDERHTTDDENLCRLSQNGDRGAEEALILRYTRLVRRCAHPLFLIGGESEDLIQEGLLGLSSAIRDYNPGKNTSFRTYAEVCVRNRLSSAITVANRQKHMPLNEAVSLHIPEISASLPDSSNPEQWVIGHEEGQELSETLRCLLSKLESDVLRYYLDGFSYREISEYLKVNPKTVDNAVQRIKTKIKPLTRNSN